MGPSTSPDTSSDTSPGPARRSAMLRSSLRLLARTFARPVTTRVRHAPRFRPRLEGFEDRLVPDSHVWSPQDGTDATVASNWRVNGDPATTLPGPNDVVQFVDTGGGGTDCTNFGGGAYQFV